MFSWRESRIKLESRLCAELRHLALGPQDSNGVDTGTSMEITATAETRDYCSLAGQSNTPSAYFRCIAAPGTCWMLTHSVTSIPCTSNSRTIRLPSTVGLNLAAASVASAALRPARVNGGVSCFGFFMRVLHRVSRFARGRLCVVKAKDYKLANCGSAYGCFMCVRSFCCRY